MTVDDHSPVGPFEERLWAAYRDGRRAVCLSLLRGADLALPITAAAAAGDEAPAWATAADAERTWVPAYTSVEAMRLATGGVATHCRIVSLIELAAGWPDPRWGLAINPGLEVAFALEPGTVARLAVPTMLQDLLLEPGSGVPVVQKLLAPRDIHALLTGGEPKVSGYCHNALDVSHIATPAVLAEALRQPEMLTESGALNILRWRPVGLDLYRTPYGGTDEEGRAAMAGWVVEEPPFVGMGLVPSVDNVIREYKVYGVGLPHGAEIWELTFEGTERRHAVYHGDLRRWLLIGTRS
ncbi:SseB protein N-terminal domain-containing protein [Nonomuraea solani]|uniref:SseB protein N-terminal domain-containing protein n=1 Tax=Nonomuraea solani TaxID=1144553 RepID=A0A1H5VRS5_9ACTN|nr:SseB family protein [Nonomuraea solani]SEF89678.1 SseB protein N-terminal domain-containing protein [Nonomuraea solani]